MKKLTPWIAADVTAVTVFLLQTGLMALLLWVSDTTNDYAHRAMNVSDLIFLMTIIIVTLAAQLALVIFPTAIAVKRFGFSYIHLLLTLPVIYILFTVFHVSFFFIFIFTLGDYFTNLFIVAVIGVFMLIAINNTKWRIKRKSSATNTDDKPS